MCYNLKCSRHLVAARTRPAARVVKVASFQTASRDTAGSGQPSNQQASASMAAKVDAVKHILDVEHETHGQGRIMWFTTDGAGRRASIGTSVQHTPKLGGPDQSIDYSLFG